MRSTDGYFFAVRHGEDDELRVQVRLLFVFGSQTTDGGRKPKKNAVEKAGLFAAVEVQAVRFLFQDARKFAGRAVL